MSSDFGVGAPDIITLGSGCSPSLAFNNLSIDAGMVASARASGVLPAKLGYRDAAPVVQVRWCSAGIGSPLLVVATTTGFQVWDSTGKSCLFTLPVADGCRGIAGSDDSRKLFVGSSSGRVFTATGSSPITQSTTIEAHSSPITALDVAGGVLASACDSGDVSLWDTVSLKNLTTFPGDGHPCTSVKLKEAYAVAAFTTGLIRILDIVSSSVAVEIAGHGRCINALDVHPIADTFASAGEDAVINVWTLPERAAGSYKVELVTSKHVEDHIFTGVQFFKSPRMAVLASSFDNNVMVLLQ